MKNIIDNNIKIYNFNPVNIAEYLKFSNKIKISLNNLKLENKQIPNNLLLTKIKNHKIEQSKRWLAYNTYIGPSYGLMYNPKLQIRINFFK